jgi:sensor c-di-GMP phosphodiesterase-like protein
MLRMLEMRRSDRLWLTPLAILAGVLAGYLVGRESILAATRIRLEGYATRLVQRAEAISAELIGTVAKANASPYPPCSDEDIALLRRLTFSARFLKDVGRVDNGFFLCSATTGKLPAPSRLLQPDYILPGGARVYSNYPLTVPAGDHAEIASFRNSDAVVGPDAYTDFPQSPIRYTAGLVGPSVANPSQKTFRSGVSLTANFPPGILESGRTIRSGGALFRAVCSQRYSVCAAAHIPLVDLWHENAHLLDGYMAVGGCAGASCAAGLLLMGRKRRSHTHQLRRAILMDKLEIAYQPIVDMDTHRIVGAEALARWVDEDGESIRPETIIQLAEAEGFAGEITRFVLTRAIHEIQSIFEANPGFRLNLNLAPSDLADPRLLLLLDECIDGRRITPANIAFELPERATSNREIAVNAIARLRVRGHAVFIDDFGTGYSNLAYLTELNVDGIKINRSFIATIGTEAVTASIVPQILAVARALDLNVVVQGIEREDQAAYFAASDSPILGQGWFFGMPVPARGLLYLCAEKIE